MCVMEMMKVLVGVWLRVRCYWAGVEDVDGDDFSDISDIK